MDEFLLKTCRSILEKGYRTVFCFNAEPSAQAREELESLGAVWFVEKFPLSMGSAYRIGRRLRSYRPNLLVTHFVSPFEIGVPIMKLSSGCPKIVITDHTSVAAGAESKFWKVQRRLRSKICPLFIDRIIGVSAFVSGKRVKEQTFSPSKVTHVSNGVNLARFVPPNFNIRKPRSLAFVGSINRSKGVDLLLEAVLGLKTKGENEFTVRIVGAGVDEASMKDYCARNLLVNVEFLGFIKSIIGLLQETDIVVIPSRSHEAFCAVAAEAMSSECCVVASDAGALPEVVGDAGVLFPSGSAAQLESALRELLAAPEHREELRKKARTRALAFFSIEKMIQGHVAQYLDVMGELSNQEEK